MAGRSVELATLGSCGSAGPGVKPLDAAEPAFVCTEAAAFALFFARGFPATAFFAAGAFLAAAFTTVTGVAGARLAGVADGLATAGLVELAEVDVERGW